METLIINAVKAEYAGNLSVKIWFDDNTTQTIDVGEFLRRRPHPCHNKYLDEKNFLRS